jgi:hypothetical protein
LEQLGVVLIERFAQLLDELFVLRMRSWNVGARFARWSLRGFLRGEGALEQVTLQPELPKPIF